MRSNVAMTFVVVALAVGIPGVASALSPQPAPAGNGPVDSTAVPEPSAAALFGLGAALVAARSRRRR
jgi:hypothetical protein